MTATTTATDLVAVTCPECGVARQISRKTYNSHSRPARCRRCGNRQPHTLIAPTTGSQDWRVRAACLRENPELFYPVRHGRDERTPQEQAAISICQSCPVVAECAEVGREERFGIWAGQTPRDRGFRQEAH